MGTFDDFVLPTREELVHAFVPGGTPSPLIRPRWAFVEQVSPLRVQMIGDTTRVEATPKSLVAGLQVNDLVWTALTDNGALIVVGRVGGQVSTPPTLSQLMANPAAIPNAADLNLYTTAGLYAQAGTAQAAAGFNYPEPLAGLLEVFASTVPGYMVWQRYTTYVSAGNPTRVYSRSFYAGVWDTRWTLLSAGVVRAKMTKSTLGHNAAGSAYSADTWTKLTGMNITDYTSYGISSDATNCSFNILQTGSYDLKQKIRWQDYGSVNTRSAAIVKGASAPATDASNVIEQLTWSTTDWLISETIALDVPLVAGDSVSFWIRSSAGSTMNETNTALPGWTSVQAIRRG